MSRKMPSYRKHKPSGQAIVVFDGKTNYLGPWNSKSSREAYHRLLGEWEASGRQAYPPDAFNPADKITVTEVLARYWRFAATYYSKGDGKWPREMARVKSACKPWKELYGATAMCDFGPLALKVVRSKFIEAGLSRGVVNSYIRVIKRVVKWAVADELIEPTIYQGLAAVAGLRRGRGDARDTPPVEPVADTHVDAIKPFISRQVWAIIELQRLSGMRPGEVVIMRGCDLDVTGGLWLYKPPQHKTVHLGYERVVDIGPQAQSVIRPFLQADLEAYLFSPRDAQAERNAERRKQRQTPMTPSQAKRKPKRKPVRAPDQRYSVASYRRAIQRACEKAGVPGWSPHQIRHGYGTRIRKQYGLEASRALLGHRSMVTSETYAELDRTRVAHIVLEVG